MTHALRGKIDFGFYRLAGISSRGAENPGNVGDFFLEYPDGVRAVLGQHGFNMFWAGVVTLICLITMWRGNKNAIIFAAIVSGLSELGRLLFITLQGHGDFYPEMYTTILAFVAIALSFYAFSRGEHYESR